MTLSSVKKKQSLAAGGEPIADHPVLVPEKAAVSRLVRGVEQDSEAEAIRALWRRIEAPVPRSSRSVMPSVSAGTRSIAGTSKIMWAQ